MFTKDEYREKAKKKFDVSFDYSGEQYLVVIDNEHSETYKIPVCLLYNDEKIASYNIVNRRDKIKSLEKMIAETYPNLNHCNDRECDRLLMKKDLEILEDSYEEEFVISPTSVKYGSNGFITKKENIEDFNNACRELIDTYKEYLKKQEAK